jgi:hypothetical protein
MLRHLCLFAFLVVLPANSAIAQNQGPVQRAITLPDTLGANFPVTDTLNGKSEATDYDFLIGTWQFTFQSRNRDGSFTQPFTGHWVFAKKQTDGRGVLLEDHWRPDDPSVTWDAGTWTYRAYNPQRKLWEMQGVSTNRGSWQPGLMWRQGDDRLLTEWYGEMLVRFRYFAIKPNEFLWRADATFDRGKTWIRDYWTMEARRVSR